MTLTWLDDARLRIMRCPRSHTALRLQGDHLISDAGDRWGAHRGMPALVQEAEVTGTDRLMRVIYDTLPALHDPATRVLTPIMQGVTERQLRRGYLPFLELNAMGPVEGRPLRILEIGVGGGANLPLLQRALNPSRPVEIWGVDLSQGMLRQCQARLSRGNLPPTLLMMADVHALPFADHSFDRVFHVGAMGNFRDPALALAEMARVARPDTPIVIVDEQLAPSHTRSLYHRLWFRALTFYDDAPQSPRHLLPSVAYDVHEVQLSPFYYCLRFRT